MSRIVLSLVWTAALILAVPGLAAPQPDLGINALWLDSANRLWVTFANEGDAEVPAGVGSLSIFVDGRGVGGYRLGNLADQSFRNPGGEVSIQTGFRLAGDLRRVSAVVDPFREIAESNELQNDYDRSLRPVPLAGPDLVIDVLGLDATLRVVARVRNVGTQPTGAPFPVRLRLVAGATARELARDLGGLEPGGARWFVPDAPALVVTSPTLVRALLTTGSAAELDGTNNVREAWLPQSPLSGELDRLLALPEIRGAIIWRDHRARTYSSWTASEQAQLRDAFARLENGETPGLGQPPTLTADRLVRAVDAWRIYLAHVAQALWVEAGRRVPWSLLDLSAAERLLLLDSRWQFQYVPPIGDYTNLSLEHGKLTDWDPQLVWRFLTARGLVGASQEATLDAVAGYLRAHLLHADGSMSRLERWGYDGAPPTDRILYPLAGRTHWTEGCQTTAPLFRALLRVVNIPVELNGLEELEGHRRPRFPTLGLTLAHADEIHTVWFGLSGRAAPLAYTLIDDVWMAERYLSPPVDCQSGRCNNPYEQSIYNRVRDDAVVATWYLTDGVVGSYAFGGAAALSNLLAGEPGRWVLPVFSATEVAWAVDRVATEVARLGGGDLALGRGIVRERMERWGRNAHGY